METGRKVVAMYIERSSWLKSNNELALTIDLLPEGRMRIRRWVGIGLKGLPDKIIKEQSLRDGPVEIEVTRNGTGEAAVEVYVTQVEEIAAGGAVRVVSFIRENLVYSAKCDRANLARNLVNQALAALGTHPRGSSSYVTPRHGSERVLHDSALGEEEEVLPPRKRARPSANTAHPEV